MKYLMRMRNRDKSVNIVFDAGSKNDIYDGAISLNGDDFLIGKIKEFYKTKLSLFSPDIGYFNAKDSKAKTTYSGVRIICDTVALNNGYDFEIVNEPSRDKFGDADMDLSQAREDLILP